ncbi:hypothetical protein VTO73DRAFT_13779 [Trametes versicolor]
MSKIALCILLATEHASPVPLISGNQYRNGMLAATWWVSTHSRAGWTRNPGHARAGARWACRDQKHAQEAKEKFYQLLDKHIATFGQGAEDHGYAVGFRRSLRLDIEIPDLPSVKRFLDYGKVVTQTYEYSSHLTFNAGTTTYSHLGILCCTLVASLAPNGELHHYIVSLAITMTNMSTLLNIILIPGYRYLMLAAFYFVCFIGSPHVLLSLYSAAIAAVHLALILRLAIPTVRDTVHVPPEDIPWQSWHSYFGKFTRLRGSAPPRVLTLRFGAENDRWGNDRPGVMAVPAWDEHQDAGAQLLKRFERLNQIFLLKEGEGAGGAAENGHAE